MIQLIKMLKIQLFLIYLILKLLLVISILVPTLDKFDYNRMFIIDISKIIKLIILTWAVWVINRVHQPLQNRTLSNMIQNYNRLLLFLYFMILKLIQLLKEEGQKINREKNLMNQIKMPSANDSLLINIVLNYSNLAS